MRKKKINVGNVARGGLNRRGGYKLTGLLNFRGVKGTLSQDLCVLIFSICSIRGTLGRFRFFWKIRQDIPQKVGSAVYDTPWNGDLAVYLIPGNGDLSVYLTLRNGDSTVHLTPPSLCQQSFALFVLF